MDHRDAFIPSLPGASSKAPGTAPAAPVWGAAMFKQQELQAELAQGRGVVERYGPRVECLFHGTAASGASIPGVATFAPIPPPHPGAAGLVATIATRLTARPALLRPVQIAVFRFEDFRRTVDTAGGGQAADLAVADLKRKAYAVVTLGTSFRDEPTLAALFPAPAPEGTAPLATTPATARLTSVDHTRKQREQAAALAKRGAERVAAIAPLLALLDAPTPPGLGELLSAEGRQRRVLAVRVARDPAAVALLRATVAAHTLLVQALPGPLADQARPCERLAKLLGQGRQHPLLGSLYGGAA